MPTVHQKAKKCYDICLQAEQAWEAAKSDTKTGDMDAAAMSKVSNALKEESLKRKSGQMTQMKEKAAQRLLEKKARGMISFDADAPAAAGDDDAVGGGGAEAAGVTPAAAGDGAAAVLAPAAAGAGADAAAEEVEEAEE